MAVVQSKRDQFLEASIDLFMHSRILWRDVAKLFKQSGATVKIIALCVQESLSIMRRVSRLPGTCLGLVGASPLHHLSSSHSIDASLACRRLLSLSSFSNGGGVLRRTKLLYGSEVVDSPHMVKKIPPAGKPVSWNRPFATFEKAKVRIVSMSVESMRLPLVAEKARIRRKL